MIEILHQLVFLCYTTRTPILLVYEVYVRSCSIPTINSKLAVGWVGA